MVVSKSDVALLQFFLMDAAKRYGAQAGCGANDVLASAAALDYALFVASERPQETLGDTSPVSDSLREAMTRAALAALDVAAAMLDASDDVFADFRDRHLSNGRLFAALGALRTSGVLIGDEIGFRLVTTSSDVRSRNVAPP